MKHFVIALFVVIVAPGSLHAAKRATNGKIAFVSNRDGNNEIYVSNADGSSPLRLTNNAAGDSDPAWSPDGTKLAYTTTRNGRLGIAVINANGTGDTLISQVVDEMPAWSPDGSRIAFASGRDGNTEIYVMAADGTNQERLTANSASDIEPSFSPDGQSILFKSDRDGNEEIYVMNVDGSNQKRLTNAVASDQSPSFSPDGKSIVFQRSAPSPQIFKMNADGTGLVQLTTIAQNYEPSFSPDGQRVLFSSRRDGNLELYTMKPDGSEQTRVTTAATAEFQPAWQPLFLRDTIGVYRPTTGQWLLRNSNTSGPADITIPFGGNVGDLPVAGDFNGDGKTDLGIFRSGTFFLATLETVKLCAICPSVLLPQTLGSIAFGQAGDVPIAGDWNGDGKDDVGVYRDATGQTPSQFLLRVPAAGGTFTTEIHVFGSQGDVPLAGDWDGNGLASIGVFHPDTAAFFLLSNDFAEADAGATFGTIGDRPIAGDWGAAGHDRVGVFHPSTATMSLATQLFATPDVTFTFGQAGDLPVAGHWTAP